MWRYTHTTYSNVHYWIVEHTHARVGRYLPLSNVSTSSRVSVPDCIHGWRSFRCNLYLGIQWGSIACEPMPDYNVIRYGWCHWCVLEDYHQDSGTPRTCHRAFSSWIWLVYLYISTLVMQTEEMSIRLRFIRFRGPFVVLEKKRDFHVWGWSWAATISMLDWGYVVTLGQNIQN